MELATRVFAGISVQRVQFILRGYAYCGYCPPNGICKAFNLPSKGSPVLFDSMGFELPSEVQEKGGGSGGKMVSTMWAAPD